jgi:hypothetical protein
MDCLHLRGFEATEDGDSTFCYVNEDKLSFNDIYRYVIIGYILDFVFNILLVFMRWWEILKCVCTDFIP